MKIYYKNKFVDCKDYYEICLYNRKGKEIARTKIDKEDLEKIKSIRWSLSNGYVVANLYEKTIYLHRLIMNPPKNKEIDHINHDKLDNRKQNLRAVSHNQNMMNSVKPRNNTSGITGVHYRKDRNKWYVRISVRNKIINLGYFKKKKNAIKVRQEAEKKYFGEYNCQLK